MCACVRVCVCVCVCVQEEQTQTHMLHNHRYIINTLSTQLHTFIDTEIPPSDRNGPLYLCCTCKLFEVLLILCNNFVVAINCNLRAGY